MVKPKGQDCHNGCDHLTSQQPLSKLYVLSVIERYRDAWVNKDTKAILDIFTHDAVYQEFAYKPAFIGHEQIQKYWTEKVLFGQDDIEFELVDLFIDGDVAIAEWVARFDSLDSNVRKEIKEVAILKFRGEKISALREYWASTVLRPVATK